MADTQLVRGGNFPKDLMQLEKGSGQFIRELFHSSIPMALSTITEGRYVEVNPSFLNFMGFDLEEVVGHTSTGIGIVTEEQRSLFIEELNKKGRIESLELKVKAKGGMYKNGLFTAVMITLDNEKFMLGFLLDISKRKQSEDALRESEEKFRQVFDNAPVFMSITDENGFYVDANTKACEVNKLSRDEIVGHKLDKLPQFIRPNDPGELERLIDKLIKNGWLRDEEVHWFRPINDENSTGLLSSRLITIAGKPHSINMLLDITERKRAEEELRKISKLQSVILNNSTVGIALVRNRHFELVNRQMTELFGISEEEFSGASTRIIFPDDDVYRNLGEVAYRLFAQGKKAHFEYEMRRGNGSSFWCRMEGISLDPAHPQDGSIWIWSDITKRKKAEEALRESEERYRQIFTEAIEGIYRATLDARPIMVNPALALMLGYESPQELLNTVTDLKVHLFHPHQEEISQMREQAMREGKISGVEFLFKHRNGSPIKVMLSSRIVRGPDGRPAYVEGSCIDITDRWIAEETLKASEQKYRNIFEGATEGIFQTTPEGRYLSVNPAFARMFGFASPQEMMESITDIAGQQYMEPQQRAEIMRLLRLHDKVEGFEARMRRKDGSKFWISINIHTVRNAGGDIVHLEGINQDITARKQAEEALRESEEKLRILMETTSAGIYLLQEDKCIYANPALEAITGYSRQEFNGSYYWEYVHPDFQEIVRERLSSRLQGKDTPSQYEFQIITKGGQERWVHLSATTLEVSGKPAVLGSVFDITERRQAQEVLREAHDELERRVQERTAELAQAGASMKAALVERNRALKMLRRREADLSVESQRLQEMNTALKVLLEKQNEDRQELEKKVLANVRRMVLPYVEKLQTSGLTAVQKEFAKIITTNLEDVVSPFLQNLTAAQADLTPREIEVASLTREGKTAKECAALMNLSIRSIESYRDNIRKKLGLINKKTNLRSYLLTIT